MSPESVKQYGRELFNLTRSKSVRDTGFVFFGNFAGQGLGFLATLVVIRSLGPAKFGLFSTAIAVMGLASQFSDLGISTGFVRYASIYLKEDQRKADILFKITLYLKLAVGIAVLFLGQLIAKPLAVYIFKDPELTSLLRLAFVGSLGATLWGYLQAILQAKVWFVKYAWINIFNNSVKLICVCVLFFYHYMHEFTAMLVFAFVPFAGFFLDSLLVPKKFLLTKGNKSETIEIFHELFHFSKWVTISTLCTMLLMRIDILMLQAIVSSTQVGIFNSANQLAMIFPLITGSITISLLPKISSYKTKNDFITYVRKIGMIFPLILMVVIPLYILSPYIISIIFGQKYLSAIPLFKVLLMAFSISIIVNSISLILYSINKASLLSYLNLLQLLIAVPCHYILIKHFGALGASWGNFIVRLLALFYISLFLYYYFYKRDVKL